MIYLICESDGLELPLATAGSLNELAEMCNMRANDICKVIQKNRKTKCFNGISARIYKFIEFNESGE